MVHHGSSQSYNNRHSMHQKMSYRWFVIAGTIATFAAGDGKRRTRMVLPCILEPDHDSKAYRKNRAGLIRKVYEVNPPTCPKYQRPMRIISFKQFQFYTDSQNNIPLFKWQQGTSGFRGSLKTGKQARAKALRVMSIGTCC